MREIEKGCLIRCKKYLVQYNGVNHSTRRHNVVVAVIWANGRTRVNEQERKEDEFFGIVGRIEKQIQPRVVW